MVASFRGACTSSEFPLLPLFLKQWFGVSCYLWSLFSHLYHSFHIKKKRKLSLQEWRHKGWTKKCCVSRKMLECVSLIIKVKRVYFTASLLHSFTGPVYPLQNFEFMTLDLCEVGKKVCHWRIMIYSDTLDLARFQLPHLYSSFMRMIMQWFQVKILPSKV